MNIKNSNRTWYGKYAYKLVLKKIAPTKVSEWLANNDYDYSSRYYKFGKILVIFLMSDHDLETLATQFASYVVEKHRPANKSIATYIQTNAQVEVRKHLLYKKYRHKITFKYLWEHRGNPSIIQFVSDQLESNVDYEQKRDWDINTSGYYHVMYLAHDSDLMTLKFTVPVEHISKILTIKLDTEIPHDE